MLRMGPVEEPVKKRIGYRGSGEDNDSLKDSLQTKTLHKPLLSGFFGIHPAEEIVLIQMQSDTSA